MRIDVPSVWWWVWASVVAVGLGWCVMVAVRRAPPALARRVAGAVLLGVWVLPLGLLGGASVAWPDRPQWSTEWSEVIPTVTGTRRLEGARSRESSSSQPARVNSAHDAEGGVLRAVTWTIASLWLAGALWVAAGIVRSRRRVARILRESGPASDDDLDELNEAAREVGLPALPTLRWTAGGTVPFCTRTCGRGAVLALPADLQVAPPSVRHAVLVHECAHVVRGDLWLAWVQQAVRVVFWWHPAMRGLLRRVDDACESAADVPVAAAPRSSRLQYARFLVERAASTRLAAVAAVTWGTDRTLLERRVERLVSKETPVGERRLHRRVVTALSVMSCLAAVGCGMWMPEAPDQGPLRILLTDDAPTWSYRYLKNAWLRDADLEVQTWIPADDAFVQEASGGLPPLTILPRSFPELASYDVLLLRRIPASMQADVLRFVREGGVLLWVPPHDGEASDESFMAEAPLAGPFSQVSIQDGVVSGGAFSDEWTLGETGTMLGAAGELHPTAEVLATATDGVGVQHPLWVARTVGDGAWVMVLSDETWRWRTSRPPRFTEFWDAVLADARLRRSSD